jgi:hypothetical protein
MKAKAIEEMRHMELASVSIDNPHYSRAHSGEKWNPPKSAALVNIRESAVSLLAAKGVLNAAQVAAADRFRSLWEALGGSGAGALDYTKEPVDGGGVSEPITVRQLEAGRQLKAASTALKTPHGEYAYRLVGYIAGEGRSIHELTETRRQRDTMTDNLRTYLDVLAVLWGFSTDRNVSGAK